MFNSLYLNRLVIFAFLSCLSLVTNGQTIYYSNGDGNFNDLSTWDDNSTGVGTQPTDIENNYFVIQSGHTITYAANGDYINSLEIEGALVINNGLNLNIANDLFYYEGASIDNSNGTVTFSSDNNSISIIEGRRSNGTNQTIPFNNLVFSKNGNMVIVNETELNIEGNFSVVNTEFESKSRIYLAGNLTIDNNSTYSTESGNYLMMDGAGDQSITVPDVITSEEGNAHAQFGQVRFYNGGNNSVSAGFHFINTLEVYKSSGSTLTFGNGNHSIRNIQVRDVVDNSGTALTFTGGNIYINNGTTINHLNETIVTNVGTLDLGTANIIAENYDLVFGDANSEGDNITLEGDITVSNGRYVNFRENTVFDSEGGTLTVNDNARVYVKGTSIPLFDTIDLSTASTFYYEASSDITILPLNYGNLRLYNAGNKIIDDDVVVNGALGVYDNTNLVVNPGNELTIHGNLENRRSSDSTDPGTIDAENATITFVINDINRQINESKQLAGSVDNVYKIQNLNIIDGTAGLSTERTFTIYNKLDVENFTVTNTKGSNSTLLRVDLRDETLELLDVSNSTVLNDFTKIRSRSASPVFLSATTVEVDQANSFVEFVRNGDQTIPALSYGNLQLNSNGNKTLAGDITVNGRIERTGGSNILIAGSNTITVYGDWKLNTSNGVHHDGIKESTVVFTGSNDQVVNDAAFGNLVFNTIGAVTLARPITIFGDVILEGGDDTQILDVVANENINLYGNWSENNATSKFSQTNGTLQFLSNDLDQEVTQNELSAFGNVTINNDASVKAIFTTAVKVDGNLRLESGKGDLTIQENLTLNGDFHNAGTNNDFVQEADAQLILAGSSSQTFRVDDANKSTFTELVVFQGEGTKTFNGTSNYTFEKGISIIGSTVDASNRTLNIKGDWSNTDGLFESTGYVNFNGGVAQEIDPTTFYRLSIDNSSNVTLNGNVSLYEFIQSSGTTFNTGGFAINVASNWIGNGTFNHQNGSVVFSGEDATVTEDDNFYVFTSNLNEGYRLTLNNDLNVENDLTLSASRLDVNGNSITVGGNLLSNGDIYNATSLILNASTAGDYVLQNGLDRNNSGTAANNDNMNIIINANAGANYILNSNIRMTGSIGDLTIQSGILNLNGFILELTNENKQVVLENGTELIVGAGSALQLSGNTSQPSLYGKTGSTIRLEGDDNNYALVEANGDDNYQMLVEGELSATNYKITDLDGYGLQLGAGSTLGVNPYNLSNGIFVNGSNSSNASITINATASLTTTTIENVTFGTGPTNAVANNSSSIGTITFDNAKGSNREIEIDASNKINWTFDTFNEWTGTNGTNWNDAGNWSGAVPTKTDNVLIPSSAPNFPILNGVTGTALKIEIENGATLTIQDRLEAYDGIFINAGATLIGGTSSDSIVVFGDWVNEGTFTANTSPLKFAFEEGSAAKLISFIPGTDTYQSVFVDAGEHTILQSDNTLNVVDFNLKTGTYDVSDSNIYLSGSWNKNGGIFNYRTATVTVDNATINGGDFFNLDVAAGKTGTLMGNITIHNKLDLLSSGSTFNAGSYLIYLEGEFDNRELGTFTHSGTIIFNGASQNIRGTATFGNVIFQGSSSKTFTTGADINVTGDVTVLNGINVVLNDGSELTGDGIFTMTGSTLYVRGANNYPSNFTQYQITGGTFYYDEGTQNIGDFQYYNLFINDGDKTLVGDIDVSNQLRIYTSDTEIGTLDVNGFEVALGSSFAVYDTRSDKAVPFLTWNNGTLRHYGGNFTFPALLGNYNNIILEGTGSKSISSNISVDGDLTINSNVTFNQGNSDTYYSVTGTSTGTLTIADNARYNSYILSGTTFATGFGTYELAKTSNTYVYSVSGGALIQLNTIPEYGNLYIRNEAVLALDGTLKVKGTLDERQTGGSAQFIDLMNDIYVGGNVYFSNYPLPSSTLFLNGNDAEVIQTIDGDGAITFNNVDFSGASEKQLIHDSYIILGDFVQKAEAYVFLNRALRFEGTNWSSEAGGEFTSTNTITISNTDGGVDQSLNFGDNHTINNIVFADNSSKTINCDINVDRTFVTSGGEVDFGSHTHSIAVGTMNLGSSYISENANFIFDGGGQNFPENFVVNDLTITNGSNKTINGNLTARNITAFENARLVPDTEDESTITVKGNWNLEFGRYSRNQATVIFEGDANGEYSIYQSGTTRFYDVQFKGSNTTYKLTNDLYTYQSVDIESGATLDVNGQLFYVGVRTDLETYPDLDVVENLNISGELLVSKGGILQFNARDGDGSVKPTLTVENGGHLSVVGQEGQLSKVSAEDRGSDDHRLIIDIKDGGKISAKFYEFKNLDHEGLKVALTATVDDTNNFSEGVFTGMSTDNSKDRVYLDIEAPVNEDVTNVTFDYNGTPNAANDIHNVRRSASANGVLTFAGSTGIAGSIKGVDFEDDQDQVDNGGEGKIVWPTNTDIEWVGGTSDDWHTGSNWSGGAVPTSSNNVIIKSKTSAGTFYPVISGTTKAECRDILIQGGRLTLASDIDGNESDTMVDSTTLFVGGDVLVETGVINISDNERIQVQENYSVTTNGTLVASSGTVELLKSTGTVVLDQNNSSFYNLEITGDATITLQSKLVVDGAFMITNTGGITLPNNHDVTFNGDVILSKTAVFDTDSDGWVYLRGTSQTLENATFKRVRFQGGDYTVTDSLKITSRAYLDQGTIKQTNENSSYVFYERVEVDNDNFFFELYKDGGTHYLRKGQWIATGTSTNLKEPVDPRTAETVFVFDNPNGSMNINGDKAFFDNLTLKTINVSLDADVEVTSLDASSSDLYLYDHQVTGSAAGEFILGEEQLINVQGANNFPSNFGNYTIAENSNTYYSGGVNQFILTKVNGKPIFYGKLTLQKEGSEKLITTGGELIVRGDLRIEQASLNTNSENVKIGGNFVHNYLNANLIYANSRFTFDGDEDQVIYLSNVRDNNFFDFTVNKANNSTLLVSGSDITIEGNMTVQNGIFSMGNREATLNKNLLVIDGMIAESGSYYMNASGTDATIQTNNSVFRGLRINGKSTTIYTLNDNITITGGFDLDLEQGTLETDNAEVIIGNSSQFNIGENASYKMGENAQLNMGNNATLNVLGNIDVIGTASVPTVIKASQDGYYYSFNLEGNINARYFNISGMSTNGIFVKSTATIDNDNNGNNFSDGTLTNYLVGGVGLKVENTQSFTANFDGDGNYIDGGIVNLNFIQSTQRGTANVSKDIAVSGQIDFYNSNGQLSGENYERDPNDLINWYGPDEFVWTGAVNTDWFEAGNWTSNNGGLPSANDDVIISATTNQPIISDVNVAYANNLILETASLVQLASSDADADLIISGNVELDGQLEAQTVNDGIEFKGNWIVNPTGSYKHGGGHLLANGDGAQVINNAGLSFGSLTIGGMSVSTLTLSGEETVSGDFTIEANASLDLDGNMKTIDFGGNVYIDGIINTNSSYIELVGNNDGNADDFELSISNGNTLSVFTVELLDANDSYTLSTNLSVQSSLEVNSGILNANGNTISFVGGNSSLININGGDFNLDGSTLLMSDGSNFELNSGSLSMLNSARVSATTSSSSYSFSLLGGNFNGSNFTFEYMNENGIVFNGVTINSVETSIDADNDPGTPNELINVLLPYAIFQYGKINGRLIDLKNFTSGAAVVGIANLENKFYSIFFNGPAQYNVVNNTGSDVYFVDSKGGISGEDYDLDNSGDVVWEVTKDIYTWVGDQGELKEGHADWTNVNNWSLNGGGAPANYPGEIDGHITSATVVIPEIVNRPPMLTGTKKVTIYSLRVEAKAGLVIEGNGNTDRSNDDNFEMIIGDEFSILSDGTYKGYVDFKTSLVKVLGRIQNDGIFNPVTSIMVLKPSNSDPINLAAGENYNDLYIDGANNPVINLTGDVNVTGLFNMDNGTLNVGENNLNVSGDFTLGAGVILNHSDGFTLTLNGAAQNITVNNQTLNNVHFEGTGIKTVLSDLTLTGDFDIYGALEKVSIGSNDITLGGNWFNELGGSNFEMASDATVTFNGSNIQTIEGYSGSETFTNFVINNSNGLISDLTLYIENSLTLTDGILQAPHVVLSKTLNTAYPNGVTSSANSYIYGKVTATDLKSTVFYQFPVGSQTTWARAAINTGLLESELDYTVEFLPQNKEANLLINNGAEDVAMEVSPFIWDITNENGQTDGAGGIQIQLYFNELSGYTLAEQALRKVIHYFDNGGGTDWYEEATTYSGDDNSAIMTASGITKFSEFGATLEEYVDPEADLPVELTYFNGAINENGNVSLKWETASEINASHFDVQRSFNGKNFETIGTVEASGNSSVAIQYYFEDILTHKLGFYRLKQVDFDGQYTLYGPVTLALDNTSQSTDVNLYAFPNPIQGDEAVVTISGLQENEEFIALVSTITGKTLMQISESADINGLKSFNIETSNWNKGIYIVKVKSKSGKTAFIKLLK